MALGDNAVTSGFLRRNKTPASVYDRSMRGGSAAAVMAVLVGGVALGGARLGADVPGHNPDLDSKCKPGFQWSRGTVGCEQAHCPPGARRTYTLDCSCGEAWGEPFRTCMEDGLATHCIARGEQCDAVRGGFDPITGGCKAGFDLGAQGRCEPAFPEQFRCRVIGLDGTPRVSTAVTFGEAAPPERAASQKWENKQAATTDADGYVTFSVADRRAGAVLLMVNGGGDLGRRKLEIAVDAQPEACEVRLYSAADAEAHVRGGYDGLLRDACLDADPSAALGAVSFDAAAAGGPRYQPQAKTIELGGLDGDWGELERTLFHEFGHAISDTIIDPSSFYIKGIPMLGKYVGGKHDNWVPNEQKDEWGPDSDPRELAFEEALADFLAMLYYRARGDTYQADYATPARAMQSLAEHGKASGSRTEGVIVSFLAEYYREQIESGPKGAAQALGDFIQTVRWSKENAWLGSPARTLEAFIANQRARARNPKPSPCARSAGPDILELAQRYGLLRVEPPELRRSPTASASASRSQITGMAVDPAAASLFLEPGQSYQLPPEVEVVSLEVKSEAWRREGKLGRVDVEAGSRFSVADDGGVLLELGDAFVLDAPLSTPATRVTPAGTEYLVAVAAAGGERFTVASGSITVVERAGARRSVTIGAGQTATFDAEAGFSAPSAADERLAAARAARLDRTRGGDRQAGSAIPWKHVPWISVLGAGLLLIVVSLIRRARRRA